mmetsp:Transcript_7732/g.8828  ORF Transcript_7732/g.8828 Transcript_7732/m.8828 type:complete len:871 (-) Transcript_7732:35-2647(-)|eukprot:CAMPEP_0194131832 /NCGR_PEP_ID=MMETSP0152-20130528/2487_1 /TAXON_ID=1049557 /ORGANISM="Thalassiothrix antarctica, Strain L6-D1" /LENGTH=870 /DNA_ID=CAMNT_0038826715 /DNA_START=114 /DNA_END=2726 /DNA_ORIENTATION=-
MVDVTCFILRWLYLCEMARDIAKVQQGPSLHVWPQHSKQDKETMNSPGKIHQVNVQMHLDNVRHTSNSFRNHAPLNHFQTIQQQQQQTPKNSLIYHEDNWKDRYHREILSLPPGNQRLHALDNLRIELIQQFEQHLDMTDETMKCYSSKCSQRDNLSRIGHGEDSFLDTDQPSEENLRSAYLSMTNFREYLPQLVAALLSSPKAMQPALSDPISNFRHLLLTRCRKDPNWGIELCWLLEAQLGRPWKTLFEHRRRLIVVLPTEKAAALAQIGTAKRATFELLQDVEQATAYGDSNYEPNPTLRCRYFGDTMHFIDRLSRISLDLRRVPIIHRQQALKDLMEEMNRRLRRRMVTKGGISLDEDFISRPEEGPHIFDISTDMIKYSVHLPLEPKRITWPGGEFQNSADVGSPADRSRAGVMRVLNIVTSECRILASRERCPYLVHLEVAETGMEGNDARLYGPGPGGIDTIIGERLITPVNSQYEEQTIFPSRGWQSYEPYTEGFGPTPYGMDRQTESEQFHQEPFPSYSYQLPGVLPTKTTGSDLLDKVFGLPWSVKSEQIRQASPFGKVKGYRLASFIVKAGEDIRREALVMQVISKLSQWFTADIPESHRPKMRPYSIMSVGGDAGLLECLSDAKSVDEIKKKTDGFTTLLDFFKRAYGTPNLQGSQTPNSHFCREQPDNQKIEYDSDISFEIAQDNFLRSLVGYSLVCYILQIKDRHNANILLDREGHIMHIDFGFVLGSTPKMGKVLFSERAPFKLSAEFWEVLGGWDRDHGGLGVKFCRMFEKAFACASSHSDEIVGIVESTLISLTGNPAEAKFLGNGIKDRLKMRGNAESAEQKTFIMNIVKRALKSLGTTTYDWLQKNMHGYK